MTERALQSGASTIGTIVALCQCATFVAHALEACGAAHSRSVSSRNSLVDERSTNKKRAAVPIMCAVPIPLCLVRKSAEARGVTNLRTSVARKRWPHRCNISAYTRLSKAASERVRDTRAGAPHDRGRHTDRFVVYKSLPDRATTSWRALAMDRAMVRAPRHRAPDRSWGIAADRADCSDDGVGGYHTTTRAMNKQHATQ